MKFFFLFLAVLTITASLIKFLKKDAWYIRFFDFPQAQVVFLGIVAFLGNLYFWEFQQAYIIILQCLLLGVLTYESIIIFPYTWVASRESRRIHSADDDDKLSIVVANVYMYNRKYDTCLQLLQKYQPDLVILVETDLKWEQHMRVLEKEYKFQVKYPIDNTYGILLYSKLELLAPEVKFLVEDDVPSIHAHVKLRNGEIIRLYALHPKPPSPTENEVSTERDAELYQVAKEVKLTNEPTIVAGDLNDVAWSRSTRLFQKISRLLDPRKGRGFFNTFHAKYPFLRWPLDHIFHSAEFKLYDIKRLPSIGSDHFPMYIHLVYCGDQDAEPFVEEADHEELREAREKIKAAV